MVDSICTLLHMCFLCRASKDAIKILQIKGDKNRTAVDKRNKPCYNKKYVWPSRILRISGLI